MKRKVFTFSFIKTCAEGFSFALYFFLNIVNSFINILPCYIFSETLKVCSIESLQGQTSKAEKKLSYALFPLFKGKFVYFEIFTAY